MDNSKANPNQRSRHFIGKPPAKIPHLSISRKNNHGNTIDNIQIDRMKHIFAIDEDLINASAYPGEGKETLL